MDDTPLKFEDIKPGLLVREKCGGKYLLVAAIPPGTDRMPTGEDWWDGHQAVRCFEVEDGGMGELSMRWIPDNMVVIDDPEQIRDAYDKVARELCVSVQRFTAYLTLVHSWINTENGGEQ